MIIIPLFWINFCICFEREIEQRKQSREYRSIADKIKANRGTINQRDRQPEKGKPEVVETVPEITEPTPEEKPKSTNMLPAILTLIVLACGGGFFVFKKVQEKKKAQEAAKPDPDADYVDDDEDYGYDPEFEDDDADAPSMKMIMNLCKQDRLDAWGNLRVAFT